MLVYQRVDINDVSNGKKSLSMTYPSYLYILWYLMVKQKKTLIFSLLSYFTIDSNILSSWDT